jgi:dihydroorotate dehydrogenase (NAD+) catalytic subunit
MADLSVELCGIRLEHPVINGSGTFDAIAGRRAFGDALDAEFPFSMFVSKTITLEPRGGNPPPRLFESPAGMVNSIGLPNKGLDGFLEHDLPELARLPVPLCVSVMAPTREGFAALVEAIGERDEVAAVELNVSCPNVKSGLIVGEQPDETRALCEELRSLIAKPIVVKLTPNCSDPAAVAVGAAEGGADAVSLINTLRATGPDPATMRPWLGAGSGGLSGPAVRAVALDQVRRVAEAVDIAVIGMGGIETGGDALAFLAAGATAIAVGTASFRDPAAGLRVRSELAAELSERGLASLPGASLASTSG